MNKGLVRARRLWPDGVMSDRTSSGVLGQMLAGGKGIKVRTGEGEASMHVDFAAYQSEGTIATACYNVSLRVGRNTPSSSFPSSFLPHSVRPRQIRIPG